jgi:hypothetical protein
MTGKSIFRHGAPDLGSENSNTVRPISEGHFHHGTADLGRPLPSRYGRSREATSITVRPISGGPFQHGTADLGRSLPTRYGRSREVPSNTVRPISEGHFQHAGNQDLSHCASCVRAISLRCRAKMLRLAPNNFKIFF